MDALIERLKQLGLNTYEAKVYLALLKHHPATGYEVSKEASVPQARAYDTLKALENQKMVVATTGKPVTYTPVPPEEILSRFEKNYQSAIDDLREALPSFSVDTVEPVHNLRGNAVIFKHAVDMIEQAKETIFIEQWSDDQPLLEASLRDAVARGVHVYVVGYNTVTYDFCKVYAHPLPPSLPGSIESTLGQRWLIMAVDSVEGMITTAEPGESEPRAIWTRNPAVVLLIRELVVHDMFLLDVELTLKDPMEKAYGSQRLKLRNKILGDQILIGAH